MTDPELIFELETHLGFRVRLPASRWQMIVTMKHPAMSEREDDVELALRDPDEIRRSKIDPMVYLFYKQERPGRWICAVAKRVDDRDGFLMTTYPTDAIKEGVCVWTR